MRARYRIVTMLASSFVVLGVATSAHADVFADRFDVVAGVGQTPIATTYQTKARPVNGVIRFSFIGAEYNMDAQMCRYLVMCAGGSKVKDIPADNGNRGLPNTYRVGTTSITAALQATPWNSARVQAQGYWQAW
jgi:hypothetical protein